MLKIKYKIATCILLFAVMLTTSCGGGAASPTNLTPLSQGTAIDDIAEKVGEKPTETKEENGSTCYIYENSKYKDYVGTTTYYCAEEQVLMCRWEYDVEDKEERDDTYFDILSSLEEEYGEFTKGENDVTYTLQTDKENIILSSFSQNNGFNIVITYTS